MLLAVMSALLPALLAVAWQAWEVAQQELPPQQPPQAVAWVDLAVVVVAQVVAVAAAAVVVDQV
jgi:hypothetical protein